MEQVGDYSREGDVFLPPCLIVDELRRARNNWETVESSG